MIPLVNAFVLLGSMLDLFLTYKYLGIYRYKFPKKDYLAIEANILVKYCCRIKGLGEGILISGTIIVSILLVLLQVLPERWKFFMAGVYYMMATFHLTNFLAIKRMKEVKTNGKKEN